MTRHHQTGSRTGPAIPVLLYWNGLVLVAASLRMAHFAFPGPPLVRFLVGSGGVIAGTTGACGLWRWMSQLADKVIR